MSQIETASATMLVLTDEQVRRRLSPPRLIEAIAYAFREEYEEYQTPVRSKFIEDSTITLVMPCQAKGAIGIKTILLVSRPGRGPRTYASSYTFHSLDGHTSAFFEANAMTELRTAATSAAATRALALESATTLGIFGTGAIAEAHVAALLVVRKFKQVLVCGTTPNKSHDFAQRMQQRHNIPVSAVDASTCASESSVICTCTTSSDPLFDGNLLQSGTHINAVGAFAPDTRELDSETVTRSRVVVDTFGGALVEAGDLLMPLAEGRIGREHILSDLHGALLAPETIRRSSEDITLFKSVGCALEDMVAARLLFSESKKQSAAQAVAE